MPDRRQSHFPNARFLPWLILLAATIVYSSTIVGPLGMHYVPLDSDAAWREFQVRAFTWIDTGSDQRADWMGNLCMLVPFGFLMTATLAPRGGAGVFTFLFTLMLSAAFVLGVKYAQVYFPPRTVTLNYVVAQLSGATVGVVLFAGSHARLVRMAWRRAGSARETLRNISIAYTAGVFAFMLMPLDFALSLDDLATRFDRVPGLLFAMPGAGRPLVVQAVALIASGLAVVPFGALMVLGPRGRNRLFGHAMMHGLAWLAAVFVFTALLLTGTPTLVTLGVRIAGLAIGVSIMPWATRRDAARLRRFLSRWSLLAVPPYLILLIVVNGLASHRWLSVDDAVAAIYPHGLLPLFNYYIVTKADAAKNIAAHMAMYLPIGLLVWARGYRPGSAFWWGALLAAAVETGRFFRPGIQGDLNTVAVAALTALLTAQLMPHIWRLLESITLPKLARATAQGPGWRERAAAGRLRESSRHAAAKAEVENL
jgi:VanZ family protein